MELRILEEFDGFVDLIVGDVAHVTLKVGDEVLYGECQAHELMANGIFEGRRFKCRTVETSLGVTLEFESIPDLPISEEREREIDEFIDSSIGSEVAQEDFFCFVKKKKNSKESEFKSCSWCRVEDSSCSGLGSLCDKCFLKHLALSRRSERHVSKTEISPIGQCDAIRVWEDKS